ncbi:MAG: hypothetical protein ABI321_06155 [Polyangia bacterium]
MKRWPAALVLVLTLVLTGASGCSSPGLHLGLGVALTLRFDGAVAPADIARVVAFAYHTTGEAFDSTVMLGRPAERVEHLVYRPLATTRSLSIAVSALDGTGTSIARGTTATLALGSGQTIDAEALLTAVASGQDLGQEDMGQDLATSDAAGDLSTPDLAQPLCPSGAFCDGFEAGLGPTWGRDTTAGTIGTDAVHVHLGAYALHLHYDALPASSTSKAQITTSEPFATARPDFWVRAYVWAASPLPDALNYFTAYQSAAPYGTMGLQLYLGTFALYNNVNSANKFVATVVPVPQDKWFCIEWHVTIGNPGTITMALDGVDTGVSQGGDTLSGPGLGYFLLGNSMSTTATTTQPAHDVWFDDLVFSSARVGCE